jgi:hypothetical protein
MNPQSQQTTAGTLKQRGWIALVPRQKFLLAVRLIAEGTLEGTEIAQQVGITPRALSSWRRKPAFMEVVAAYRERIDKEVMESARKLLAEVGWGRRTGRRREGDI